MIIIRITIIGDAFVDIIVPADDINIGDGRVYNKRIITKPGGTSNVAVNIKRLGENVLFVSMIGKDCFGDFFESELINKRIEFICIKSDMPTGLCFSLMGKNKDRTMVVSRGANDFIDRPRFYEAMNLYRDSKIIYLSGYLLQSKSNRKIIWDISKELKDCSSIWFNPGSPNIISKEYIKYVKEYVDYLILNFDEAKNMSSKKKLHDIFQNLEKVVENIVITDGKSGCYILTNEMNKPIHVPPKHVINVVDSTGAGDAFSGGYLVGYINGKTPIECGMLGNESALKIITKFGGWDYY